MTVSDNIRRLRQERGLTQEELSDLFGVARSTVTQWERGWSAPRMGMVRQLAKVLHVTPEEIGERMGIDADRVREIQKISQEPVSLETPIGEEEDSQLGDFIEDTGAVVPPDAASFPILQDELSKVLDSLADRERKVIELRFGLIDGHPRTLKEVGREFGVTRERIRQIESKTLLKLRHPSRSNKLRDFISD